MMKCLTLQAVTASSFTKALSFLALPIDASPMLCGPGLSQP